MFRCGLGRTTFLRYLTALLWIGGANAQVCLVLSRPTIGPNNTATFELSLNTLHGEKPAAIQWAFHSSTSDITSLTMDDGPALGPAGKSLICGGTSGSFTCVAVGRNAGTIGNGIVARVVATLAAGGATGNLTIDSGLGASGEGYFIPVICRYGAPVYLGCTSRPQRRGVGGKWQAYQLKGSASN